MICLFNSFLVQVSDYFKTFSALSIDCMLQSHGSDSIWLPIRYSQKWLYPETGHEEARVYERNYISNVKDF